MAVADRSKLVILLLMITFIFNGCQKKEEETIILDNIPTYSNPFSLEKEWSDYGIGDPFVMRYNGRYYLYVSTKDNRVGIKAWSSDDLIHWEYEGLVTEDERTSTAYAPEVVYWNGTFYMYTSPGGNGHYVLSSKSPLGPFKVDTENLGMSIDGSVFIDDDGSWYFTHSGPNGIVARPMKDPYTFEDGVVTEAFLGHWTEGSMIIKENDLYYMTYTGNHVFSKGYRINYAISEKSPLRGYEVPDNNPLLISTEEDFHGLGHNSLVRGPNLDSYYIVYHNLVGRSQEGPPVRSMNIDRLIFNGRKLAVLGPTNYSMPVPEGPDYEKRRKQLEPFDRVWLSDELTEDHFTAEYNFVLSEQQNGDEFLIVFSYHDDKNYNAFKIDPISGRLHFLKVVNGEEQIIKTENYPSDINFNYLHTVRLETAYTETRVYLDNMKVMSLDSVNVQGGKIGYFANYDEALLGYTAFTNHVDHTSDFDLFKPLPGSFEAIHYLEGENIGYYIKNPVSNDYVRENVPILEREDGTYAVFLQNEGDWLKYPINVSKTTQYEISMNINPNIKGKNVIKITAGDNKTYKYRISEQDISQYGGEESTVKVRLGIVHLEEGFQTLKVEVGKGSLEIISFDVYEISNDKFQEESLLENVKMEDIHGLWRKSQDGYRSQKNQDMKIYVGDELWTDIETELIFEINDNVMNEAGILLRVNHESLHEHQVSDALIGYFISLNPRVISLKKLNYDSTLILSEAVKLEVGKEHHLRVRVQGNRIEAYIAHEKEPILSYIDPMFIPKGKIGIRSVNAEVHFKKMSVKSLQR